MRFIRLVVVAVSFLAGLPALAAESMAYTYELDGLTDKATIKLFNELSVLKQNKDHAPRSLAELRGRVLRDVKSLERILRSRGHYLARVTYRVERTEDEKADKADAGGKYKIILLVKEGPRYRWTKLDILWSTPEAAAALAPVVEDLRPSMPRAMANSTVINLEKALLQRLPEVGYPEVKVLRRDVVVDHATQQVSVTFEMAEGPPHTFGPVTVSGLEAVRPGYLQRLRPWKEGDVYDARLVDDYRTELARAGLFTSLFLTPDFEAARDDPAVPIQVEVSEGAHRTYGAGAAYSTSEGFGANTFWQHRNFFGGGERLDLMAIAAEQEQTLGASLDVAAFRRRDQRLLLDLELTRENPEAFTRYGVEAAAALERPLSRTWTGILGVSLEYDNITDAVGERDYYLLGARGALRWDRTDSLLDPRRGVRFFIGARPYVGHQSGALHFTVLESSGSAYFPFDDARRYVLAARVKIGSVVGATLDRLPADKRFYAGGGNSVRGYRYQFAGDLDADGVPVGGRSLVEAGLEARLMVTERIGIVPFVEVGQVDRDALPDFSQKLFWGAGLGVRYHTDFAPVRLDIAFPLSKRPEDNTFQLYISLGQSF